VSVAQTNALRNFLLNEFMVDNRGRDGDDVLNGAGFVPTSGYVSQEQKASIKANVEQNNDKWASETFARKLYERIMEARQYEPEFGAAALEAFFEADGTPKMKDGHTVITKADASMGMAIAEEIVLAHKE
jgi:hypothetical protein